MLVPPQPKPTSPITIVAICLLLLYGLYRAFTLWGPAPKPPEQIRLPAVPLEQRDLAPPNLSAPIYRTDTAQPDFNDILQPQYASVDSKRTVIKCVKNGKITFTDSACADGATKSKVNADNPMVGTVAPLKRSSRAPKALNPDQAGGGRQDFVVTTQSTQPNRIYECTRLSRQVEQLDASARQPRSGSAQDSIRADRARLRTRQADLKC